MMMFPDSTVRPITKLTLVATARRPGEIWEVGGGLRLGGVHFREDCKAPCVIHYPSVHHMTTWPLHWRLDRLIFERICPHGVGHPDPDQFSHWEETGQDSQSIHGCDGCCAKEADNA